MVFFACPDEILSADTPRPSDAKSVTAMAKALGLLGYDAGTVTRAEAKLLADAGAALPPGFAVAGETPTSTILTVAGIPIGVVRFPDAPASREPMPAPLAQATAEAAAALRPKVKLVVGLSGWGSRPEEAFLNAHPGAVDVLLGSGPGSGLAGSTTGGGRTLWARTYYEGKTVNRLDLYTLPATADHVWDPKTDFRTEVIALDDRYPADPEIEKLF
jgi:hypothetical protein